MKPRRLATIHRGRDVDRQGVRANVYSGPKERYIAVQARLEFTRFPTSVLAFVFALVLAALIGGMLGYVIRPATPGGETSRVVVIRSDQLVESNSRDNACVFIDHHKAC